MTKQSTRKPKPSTIEEIRNIIDNNQFKPYALNILNNNSFDSLFTEDFHTAWIEKGHRMREQINNDAILIKILRKVLPPYTGESLTLYRGENVSRYETGKIGLCWTARIETAEMFASGLNSYKSGGLLISSTFSPQSIISTPCKHSVYLGENQYTIDVSIPFETTILKRFPNSH